MAADAYAHAIRPTHTTNDGDTIYVLASGSLGADASARIPLDLIGLVGHTTRLRRPSSQGAPRRSSLHGLPAHRDIAAPQSTHRAPHRPHRNR
ncbi:MAG: hypothetical protein ACLTSX_01850 [Collinsella sp.]